MAEATGYAGRRPPTQPSEACEGRLRKRSRRLQPPGFAPWIGLLYLVTLLDAPVLFDQPLGHANVGGVNHLALQADGTPALGDGLRVGM